MSELRHALEWVILVVLLLVLGCYVAFTLRHDYQETERSEFVRLLNQTSVVEKNVLAQIATVDTVLDDVRNAVRRSARERASLSDLNQRLMVVGATVPGIRKILVIDAHGRVLAASAYDQLGQVLADKSYFAEAQQATSGDALYFTPPVTSSDHTTVMGMYRLMQGPPSVFSGMVIAIVNPTYFGTLLESVRYNQDTQTAIAHSSGTLFVAAPALDGATPSALQSLNSQMLDALRAGQGSYAAYDADGRALRMRAVRAIQSPAWPMEQALLVTVSRDAATVFADVRRARYAQTTAFGALALISTCSLFLYQRRQRTYMRLARLQEQALRNSEARLHSFFDSTPDALLISDASGNITMANRQVEKLLGYTADELLSMSIESLVPSGTRPDHAALRTSFTENPSARRMGQGLEVRALRKDGTECDVEISLSRIRTEEGQFFASALRDITQRKYADEQLRIAAVSFESHQGVVVTDANTVILRVNGAFTTITGYSADESVGRRMSFLNSNRHDEPFWHHVWASIQGTQKWEGEVWNRHKSGETHPHSLTIAAVLDSKGQVTHYIGTYTDISDRKRIEENLVLSEARLRTIIESEPQCIKIVDSAGRLKQMNPAGLAMIEADSMEQVLGCSVVDLVTPEYKQAYMDLHARVLAGESVQLKFEIRGLKGTLRQMQTHAVPMDDQGRVMHLAVTRDITAEHLAEAELRIAAVAFESQEGMVVTDAQSNILRVNRAFTEITGYTAEEVVGLTPRILRSDRHPDSFFRAMWECIHRTGSWHGEIWDRRKCGEVYPKWLAISAVKGHDGVVTHYIGTAYDITERKRAEEKINELAFFDQLTGLPNRTLLLDRLKQVVAGNNRNKAFSALLFIDLDNFKTLNDTLGHDMGDQLLKQVAQRLKLCVRDGDTVARLGGDEFVVVLKNVGLNDLEAASGTEVVAEKILTALNQPYQLSEISHRSTSSIGATVFNGNASAIDELMKQADLAMYKSKSAGRNAFRFFDPSMEAVVKERAALEEDLVRAMSLNQFTLHYQAQIEGDGHVSGAEVLLRWSHPVRGMVSPAEFIPLAEETGLILKLGEWVLHTACCQLALWAAQEPMQHLTIAVNVSAHQFRQANFVEQVLRVLGETGANPRRLKLELTESLLIDNVQDIITKMVALKASGVGFSLDDFGTGYSSLSYLKRLPLDQLKIDQSFVRDVLTDPNDASIAKTIVALAASLGLNVIAEGVETLAQRDFLAVAGCQAYQGYLFSKPVSISQFEAYAHDCFARPKQRPICEPESIS